MHPDHRFSGRADRIRHEELGHHDALEKVGGLADDDGVDVVPIDTGIRHGAIDGLADKTIHGDVVPLGDVLCLPSADDSSQVLRCTHVYLPSNTATRFCCSTGPLVA
ncbi:Uncharacterised protein [Mycobacteroides abscessus subsp. abscessus]|nr:Uncharacterised protein [Mycobacteroides abscessus subsp. abscessus]